MVFHHLRTVYELNTPLPWTRKNILANASPGIWEVRLERDVIGVDMRLSDSDEVCLYAVFVAVRRRCIVLIIGGHVKIQGRVEDHGTIVSNKKIQRPTFDGSKLMGVQQTNPTTLINCYSPLLQHDFHLALVGDLDITKSG